MKLEYKKNVNILTDGARAREDGSSENGRTCRTVGGDAYFQLPGLVESESEANCSQGDQ